MPSLFGPDPTYDVCKYVLMYMYTQNGPDAKPPQQPVYPSTV